MKRALICLLIYSSTLFAFEQSFIFHGKKDGPLWSIQVPKNQTNSLTLKIQALPTPTKGTKDSLGNVCEFIPVGHNKILIELGTKDLNTGLYFDRTIIDNIAINEESKEKILKVVPNNREMTLDIISISWDYTCNYHLENTKGFDKFHRSYSQYCPWDQVWPYDCVAFKLQYQ